MSNIASYHNGIATIKSFLTYLTDTITHFMLFIDKLHDRVIVFENSEEMLYRN